MGAKLFLLKKDSNDKLTFWESSGVDDYSENKDLKAIPEATNLFPSLDNNGRINLNISGNYFRSKSDQTLKDKLCVGNLSSN